MAHGFTFAKLIPWFERTKLISLSNVIINTSKLAKYEETLGYTIRIGITPTILYFDLHLYSANAAHNVYLNTNYFCMKCVDYIFVE